MISIIICTYNRCATLLETLDSLTRVEPPEGDDWELILVDNNSNDDTAPAVHKFARSVALRTRYVFESKQGLSHARNAGVNAASGHLLLFTDDDVVVDRGWVRAMKRVFGSTGCMGAGGRIVPAWRCDRPEWLATEGRYKITNVIPDFDLGPEQRPLDRAAVGANMGFSKEAFKRYGLFRTDLGRRGNDMMGGEETELFERLFAAGEKAMYVPDAVVNHPVNAYQITIPRVQAWYFGAGRYHAMVEDSPDAAKWFGVPRHLFRKCAAAGLNWTFSIGAQPRAYHRFKTFLFLGSIVQHRELAKEAGAMVPSGNAKCDGNGPPRR